MFGVYLAVGPEQVQEAVGLVARELCKLARLPVDPAELKGVVEYTKGNLLLGSESADNQMVRIAQNEIHFQADIALETVLQRIEAVQPEDLLELADELFRPDRLGLTLLGPVDADPAALADCLKSAA
jgi:predicted Zn-dependent peptidase